MKPKSIVICILFLALTFSLLYARQAHRPVSSQEMDSLFEQYQALTEKNPPQYVLRQELILIEAETYHYLKQLELVLSGLARRIEKLERGKSSFQSEDDYRGKVTYTNK